MPEGLNNIKLFYTDREVGERYGVSRLSVWRWVRDGRFPPPVKVGSRATRWRLADLEAFEAELGQNAA